MMKQSQKEQLDLIVNEGGEVTDILESLVRKLGHYKSTLAIAKQIGVSPNTLYYIAHGNHKGTSINVAQSILNGLGYELVIRKKEEAAT